ncbi:SpoIID/LytB domain-containing protein [Cellulomonas triticagri]|uniref:SpoIID/LytB domain-containing protein n=1 Tax=Cellulomonas triticagri TaxID=2483352 RepID=A0A3M2JRE4_9CELL|nr:SpoIID/LytB domain-containing protein [Cellulomonas triticagri]RMI13265.1 SpoIID/LytB domain-containing protein [Cellulomonas triticagri]
MNTLRRLTAAVVAALLTATGLVALAPAASAAEEVYPAPASGSWTVDGRAYGHGRGMSQWGAQGAALQGRTASQILDFYYPGTGTGSVAGQYVKATLAAFAPSATVTVWSPENRNIRMGPINGEVVLPPGRWTVTMSGGTVTAEKRTVVNGPVVDRRTYSGVLRFESQNEYGMIVAASQSATTGRWYRGDLRIEPTSGTTFNVTNSLPMEDYLRSVVPRESPASWEPAALQAQSVAARSYAWWKVTRGQTLCDTTTCQVYYGRGVANAAGALTTSYEHSRSDAAIAATNGQVRTYGGSVAFTEFSSSNGGWTAAGSVPYQVAKADPWTGSAPGDTVTAWTATLAVSRVAQSCPGSGGTLRNLVVTGRTGNGPLGGRISQVRLECSTGNATVNTPAFGLRSSWWQPRATAPVLGSPAFSATTIDHGAQMSIGVTPNLAMSWTLTVVDRSTGRRVTQTTGSAQAGTRFNATWFGTYDGRTAADPPYVGPGTYNVTLTAVDPAGRSAAPVTTQVTVRPPADPAAPAAVPLVGDGGYVPVTPARITDTRTTFQSLGPGRRADVAVLGRGGVPASGVTAVVLNVTAVGSTVASHLRVWPAGSAMPNASVLNTAPGRTQASQVAVGVGGDGKVSVYNATGTTHYVVDVLGYYTTDLVGSARYTPVDPARALDSRTGGALAAGSTRAVDVASVLGVPAASLGAVTVNVTTTRASGAGYVVAYGAGALPTASTVNLVPGADIANRAVVPVVDGKITLGVQGSSVHVLVDVVGWYGKPGAAEGSLFTPVQPSRVLDTRGGAPVGPAAEVRVQVTGGAVPPDATAVSGTVTAVNLTAPWTHVRVWPDGEPRTGTSDLNATRGYTQANAVTTRTGVGGGVRLYNDQGTAHLILDVAGYFR